MPAARSAKSETKPSKAGLGDKPLYQPEDGKANVDIVFVHGINGDRIDTWTRKDADDPNITHLWPQEFLPEVLPKARIVSFGYNAVFAKFWPQDQEGISPELTIDDFSTSLLESLRVLRQGEEKERPIIFVAHSMGGLVVANALSRNHKSDAGLQTLVDHTIGLLFLGTPFQGSSLASYGELALSILTCIMRTQEEPLETLKKKSRKLADTNQQFAEFLRERDRAHNKPRLEVACFFEEHPIGNVFVVPKLSATWLGVRPLSIDANHRDMCRFASKYSAGYKSVAGKLVDWIKDYEKNKTAGEVGGLNAQAINISGDVDYRGAQISQSITLGNVVATTEKAVYLSQTNHGPPSSGGHNPRSDSGKP